MTNKEPSAALATEQMNQRSAHLDQLNVLEIVSLMNEEDMTVPLAVQRELPAIAAAIDAIVGALEQGGRLYYFGAGTSGRLGILDASECPPTYGVSPELVQGVIAGGARAMTRSVEDAEDNREAGQLEARERLRPGDAVVGISAAGGAPYVLGAMEEARALGAVTAGLSCNHGTRLSASVDYPIEVEVGPEIVTGSTRLKAGTATKMVLNMITTAAMIRLGKVHGNLMVNVQATNAKLKDRVVRIVQQATGLDKAEAARLAGQAGGDARIAILMQRFAISAGRASQALTASGDHFGKALQALEGRAERSGS
ncbi:N-acetylmuramic acid 6-phosphate etherase [Paenibacillus sp. IB182496]|uniref:N-acetylmuramic acid 6-phosphate etherase n=1 Tax=Paenibacillus sabuli TaxID=2772509 RepID=A0A927BT70_9BACL|nr:N-acetylmuramic acid 6-phosphate etherase [Paenibacillus sabuli]MBD2846342.1 N-acetylmuramic acid 6-phosphate etherase [Paenibacillus sabuli]